jgi:hypothetical protein
MNETTTTTRDVSLVLITLCGAEINTEPFQPPHDPCLLTQRVAANLLRNKFHRFGVTAKDFQGQPPSYQTANQDSTPGLGRALHYRQQLPWKKVPPPNDQAFTRTF